MRLLRIGEPGHERAVVKEGEKYFDISGLIGDIDRAFWDGGVARVSEALVTESLPEISIDGERIGAPIARPGAVVCIGQNYAAHAAESGSQRPEHPIMFFKAPNTIGGPNDDVRIAPGSTEVDWEVELAVVIGRRASFLASPTEAPRYIAGFLVANDLSERHYQRDISGGQWSKGKTLKGYCPLGPELVTSDALDASDLRLRSWVNGEPRQDSRTSDMIFGVDFLIYELSQCMEFEPGDVLLTGTPEGVAMSGRFPYLRDGDIVELEIESLGRQRQRYVSS